VTAPLDHHGSDVRPAEAGVRGELRDEVLSGLCSTPKTLPPKLFYDELGAVLFERITLQPEYYLTGAELEILETRSGEIAELAGAGCALVEYGSGAGVKVRLLLDALERPAAYVPIDISAEQLARVAGEIAAEYPGVSVRPAWADYTGPLQLPDLPVRARRIAFFPGSTIGNFHPAEAAAFLRRVRRTVADDGALVLGVDRRKDATILNAAYNDANGLTAAFNINILRRINRDLDADFDLSRFEHRASFNEAASRVEMHLVSLERQTVTVAGVPVRFERGETIWTESSYKYDETRLRHLAEAAGFAIVRLWTDARRMFWVGFLVAA
jgi:L-histidine Nalpha-methyltransferase